MKKKNREKILDDMDRVIDDILQTLEDIDKIAEVEKGKLYEYMLDELKKVGNG